MRRLLVDRGIVPENLPPAEDIKKIERRLESEQKKLPKTVGSLELSSANHSDDFSDDEPKSSEGESEG